VSPGSVQKIPVSCNKDCGGACPLIAHVREGRVRKITNNPLGGPYMNGCVRGFQAAKILYSPDRLRKPLMSRGPRGAGLFKEIEWTDAFDIISEKLDRIRSESGGHAVLPLGGSGSFRGALHSTARLIQRFLALSGGYAGTYGNYSSDAASFTLPFVLGRSWVGIDPGTLQSSNLILLWGANISDCRFGTEMPARIREAKKRGVEVIVIDPRKSRTASELGTRWIPVLPGTDTALMMAVLYILIEEDLIDKTFIKKYSVGFDSLKNYVLGLGGKDPKPKTPAWAEKICGTPASDIVQLARQYGRTSPAALIPGLSIQRTIGGEESVRMAVALQVVTGNFGKMGGSSGAVPWFGLPGPLIRALEIPANPSKGRIPLYRWADAVLEGTSGGFPGEIRAIYNVGGNYLVQGSDIQKNIQAFEKIEFSVCHDYFMTPTAKYCDLVLPVTTFLEKEDIVLSDGGNYLLFSNKAVEPLAEARDDYDIFTELAGRLGFKKEFTEGRSKEDWLKFMISGSEVPDYEAFRHDGIYWGRDRRRVAFSNFIKDPEAHKLGTPSGLVEISSIAYAKTGFSDFPECRFLPVEEEYPLRLVTPKSRNRVHSQNYNISWFKDREKQALWINPEDAALRGIKQGSEVLVESPEGRICIEVRITEEIMKGVTCLLEGAWPCFDSNGIDYAGSPNVLTSTVPTTPSQGSRTHSVLVRVRPAAPIAQVTL